jgi:hypothetical protein
MAASKRPKISTVVSAICLATNSLPSYHPAGIEFCRLAAYICYAVAQRSLREEGSADIGNSL